MLFIKIIASIFLLIGIISPETSWKMSEGWKFKDAEPSEGYLYIYESNICNYLNHFMGCND